MTTPTKICIHGSLAASAVLLLAFISLWIGPSDLSIKELWQNRVILWEIRFPRIILGFFVGGALALSGQVFQGVLRNPLADPYILGVASAASFGASCAIVLGLPTYTYSLFAFLGALSVIYILPRAVLRFGSSHALLLMGVLLSFLFSSLVYLALSIAQPFESAKLLTWLMGSLSQAYTGSTLGLVSVIMLLLVGLVYRDSFSLNLLNLGEEEALTAGIPIHTVKKRLFLVSSLLTAIAVSLAGTIGFVGFVVPHFSRLLWGQDNRLTLPLTFFGGAFFLIFSDTSIRALSTQEIPIGIVTALFGAPLFLILLWRKS